jgi:hypothetical protein
MVPVGTHKEVGASERHGGRAIHIRAKYLRPDLTKPVERLGAESVGGTSVASGHQGYRRRDPCQEHGT